MQTSNEDTDDRGARRFHYVAPIGSIILTLSTTNERAVPRAPSREFTQSAPGVGRLSASAAIAAARRGSELKASSSLNAGPAINNSVSSDRPAADSRDPR